MSHESDKAMQNFYKERASREMARLEFVVAELDLATIFCEMALSARSRGSANRNVAYAREAFDLANAFLDKMDQTTETARNLRDKTRKLGLLLHELQRSAR